MKVGKKVLSMVLAIVMVISSVSVCFGVLGSLAAPENPALALENLMTQIELHYATLADYILAVEEATEETSAEALKKVPKPGTTGTWEVELDSSTSSWYWVTSAYANVAAGKTGSYTIKGLNDAIKADVANKINATTNYKGLTAAQFNEILDYYAFGEATSTVVFDIGEGFDILQWAPKYDDIPVTSEALQLYSAKATFTVDSGSGKVTAVDFENIQQDSESLAGNMEMVKEAIADFIGKADTWFSTDYKALDVETLNSTVKAISEDIVTYELAVTVGNYEEVWDAYVAPNITGNRKWAEVKQWYKTNIVGYVADAYATQYQSTFESLFTTADGQTTGADLLETYKLIQLQLEKLDEQTAYNGDETVNITDMIIEAFAEKNDLAAAKYYAGVLSRHEALGHKLAEAFANEQFNSYVSQFQAMVDTATTKHTYVTSAEAKAMGHKWEESCDGNCSQKCPASGKVTKDADGNIVGYTYTAKDENGNDVEYTCTQLGEHCVHDNYNYAEDLYFGTDDTVGVADVIAIFEANVFPYITDAAGTVNWGYLVNVGKNSIHYGQTSFVTLNSDNWIKYYNAAGVVNLDVNGATYKEYKAKMDAYMDAAILTGSMTYAQISNMVNDMLAMGYKSCKELSTNAGTKDLFEKIFGSEEDGKGMKPYDEFINDLKRRAVNRIYDLISQVNYYYDEGDGAIDGKGVVAYHNFEAILGAYSAVSGEAIPGVLLKFLNAAPVYDPDATQFAEKEAADPDYVREFDEVSAHYDSVTTDQNGQLSVVAQAEAYRDMLKQLRNSAGGKDADRDIRDMLFDRHNNANNYNSSSMYQYIWQQKNGSLDYSFVQTLLDTVGLTTDKKAKELLTTAIDSLDAILISEDMGTLLGSLLLSNMEDGQLYKEKANDDGSKTKLYGYVGTSGSTKEVFWLEGKGKTSHTYAGVNYTLTKITNALGVWEVNYTYQLGNGNTKTVTKGQEIKDLKEYLINLIISYLYSGELPTLLFKALNEMVGPMIYDMAGEMNLYLEKGTNGWFFPAFLRCTLGTMPWMYTENSSYGATDHDGVQFRQWFDGSFNDDFKAANSDNPNAKTGWPNYSNTSDSTRSILWVADQAPIYKPDSDASLKRAYWAEETTIANVSEHKGTFQGVPASAWEQLDSKGTWQITDWDSFYKAMASATSGYHALLGGLIAGSTMGWKLKAKVLFNLSGTIQFYASNGSDTVYDAVLLPLYELLGIPAYNAGGSDAQKHGYRSASQLVTDCSEGGVLSDNTYYIKNFGYDVFYHLLDPIVYWLETQLLANPIGTILDLLPNLLAAVEYNQLRPKLDKINLHYAYSVSVVVTNVTGAGDMYLSKDTILPLVDNLGVELTKGFTGILESLTKTTRTEYGPTYDDTNAWNYYTNFLLEDEKNSKGEVLYYDYNANASGYNAKYTNPVPASELGENSSKVTKKVAYRDDKGNYYLADGLLSQTLFGLAGENIQSAYTWKNGVGSLSLTIPTNRLMAMCSASYKDVTGIRETHHIYHLTADHADVLLVLLRWLMNDGVLTVVGKLLGSEGMLGTILGALTGQADNIVGILVSLLNEYKVNAYEYKNIYADKVMNWQNKDLGVEGFVLGQYLTESAGSVNKINTAIKNVDNLIPKLLPTILSLLGDTLDGFLGKPLELLGHEIDLSFIKTKLDNFDPKTQTLADLVADIIASNELMDIVATILFAPTTTTNDKGEVEQKDGLLPGLLGSETVAKLIPALAKFGFDVSPNGFYKNVASTGKFANAGLADWLKSCGADSADCSWSDIVAPDAGYNWYKGLSLNSAEAKIDAFFSIITDLISPLNSIFSLILCGEDLTFFDKLTLEGGNGYARGINLIIEALGVGDVTLPDSTYKASMTEEQFMFYCFGDSYGKGQNGNRNWTFIRSPLTPVFTAIRALLVGDDASNTAGILESPLTVLLEKIPNIAFFMYTYDTDEMDEKGMAIRTSNLAEAVKNIIAPVLKILDIIDPVLSKILELDVGQLIVDILDIETTLNKAISTAIAAEGLNEEQINISSFIDFGALAVCGGTMTVYNTKVDPMTLPGATGAFHRSVGVAGQTLVTLVRSLLTEDMLKLFSGMYTNFISKGGIDGTDKDPEVVVKLTQIAEGLVDRCKTPVLDANGKYNGTAVDILVGIIVDLLTDYEPGTGVPMFYEVLGDALNGNIDDAAAYVNKYAIEHVGYDWATVTKDENGNVLFTEKEVNETMDSLDIVISKALPDILNILTSTGVLDLSSLGVELAGGNAGLFDIVAGLLGDLVFTDEMMTTIYDLLMGVFGGGVSGFRDIAKEAGFDFTAKTLYTATGANAIGTGLKAYMSYNLDIAADGTVDGEDLTWEMIKKAHSIQAYEYDENGNVVTVDGAAQKAFDENGAIVYDSTMSFYTQKTNEAGEYIYTYTNAKGEAVEYTSALVNLKSFAEKTGTKDVEDEDGNTVTVDVYTKYDLTPVYTETKNPAVTWTFGFLEGNENFYKNLDTLVSSLWDFISQLEPLLEALFFGEETGTAMKAFDTLNIEGQDTYANTILPLLRGFGLDAILMYLDENKVLDDKGNATNKTYLQALNEKRGTKYGVAEIPNALIGTNEEMYAQAKAADGTYDMEKFLQIVVNYVFYFVEILAEYPIATLANMLPTLAYFIVGDGLNEVVSNLLTFVMVFIERLGPVLSVSVNDLGAGLIDYLGTNTWDSFQEIFKFYEGADGKKYFDEITYDEDGNIVRTPVPAEEAHISLTEALLSFVANIKLDMAGIYGYDEPYYRTITAFIDADVENAAWDIINANTDSNGVTDPAKLEAARQLRSVALTEFLRSLAALGDPIGGSDETNYNLTTQSVTIEKNNKGEITKAEITDTTKTVAEKNLVKIDPVNGQLRVSKADVLMFLLDFIFANTTLKEVLGSALGYDITDENGTDAELLDNILTGVFRNPDQVVDLIVTLFTEYQVGNAEGITLMAIEEQHYDFYDDAGLTYADVTADGYNGSIIARTKTAYAIDNLDKLVGTVLNLFKADLTKEGALLNGIVAEDADLTLSNLVNTLLEGYLFTDDIINDLLGMLVGLLASDDVDNILGALADILNNITDANGNALNIKPAAFKNNAVLEELIGDATSWKEVGEAHKEYEYKYATQVYDAEAETYVAAEKDGKPVYESYYNASAALNGTAYDVDVDEDGTVDYTATLEAVYNEKQASRTEGDKTYYSYTYTTIETVDGQEIATKHDFELEEAGVTTYEVLDAEGEPVLGEDGKAIVYNLAPVMVDDTTSQKTAVKFHANWNIVVEPTDAADADAVLAARKASRTKFVEVIWDILEPLSMVLELFLTGGNITLYGEITLRGFDGYESVILPIIEALGVPVLADVDGNNYLATYYKDQASYELAVYGGTGEDDLGMTVALPGDKGIMLHSIIDALFALVDSLCERPVSTLATVLPYLARFLESDGVDAVLANLLSPVTAITDLIKNIYNLDIMGLIKGLLYNVAGDMEGKLTDYEDKFAAYLAGKIEEAEGEGSTYADQIALVDNTDENQPTIGGTGVDFSKLSFMDIVWDIVLNVYIEIGEPNEEGLKDAIKLKDIINDQLLVTIASCAWYDVNKDGTVMIKTPEFNTQNLDNSESVNTEVSAEYVVDRESVLLTVLESIVFQPGVRDLLAKFVDMFDFSDESLKAYEFQNEAGEINVNGLLSVLVYGVFNDPQAIEALLINLLSWYNIVYEEGREVPDTLTGITGNGEWTAPLNKDELNNLPTQLDNLITAVLPLVGELLPALGVELPFAISGDNVEAIVENLLTSLFVDSEDKAGLATTIFTALVELFGKNKLDSILDLVYELTGGADGGINLTLKYFKQQNATVNAVFAGLDTWEAAYEAFKVEKAPVADDEATEGEE
ncbi:MAG: hypothetical protein IKY78_08930, partial [Clostridia bacterium]|nr:hypothetical protein [Clostridia bacterium]